jgi:phosphoglycerate dehydrogenase-like enzyme
MQKLGVFSLPVVLLVTSFAASGQQRPKIVVSGLNPGQLAELKAAAPKAAVVGVDGAAGAKAEIADADALMGLINADLILAGKKLRWVQSYSAGVERAPHEEMTARNITLTNCKIIQGPEIADHGFAMLLTLSRRIHEALRFQADETWERMSFRSEPHRPIELNGKTALVIGVGGIGTQVAQRAKAFGMRVIGVDPKDLPYMPFVDATYHPDQLDQVLPEADVVFMAAPHTPESEKMLGSRQFNLLKRGSYFIALSRGKTYSMDALVKALDEKRLAGAGVDVTDPEPLPKGHALWKFDNVVITPHYAGQSDRVWDRRMALLKENARRFTEGAPLRNVVDKSRRY